MVGCLDHITQSFHLDPPLKPLSCPILIFAEKLFSQNSHFHFPVQYWFLLKNCFFKILTFSDSTCQRGNSLLTNMWRCFFYICDIQIYTHLKWAHVDYDQFGWIIWNGKLWEPDIYKSQSEQEALFFWLVATLTSVNKTAITFTFDHFSHHLLQPSSHCQTIQKENVQKAVLKKVVKNLDNRTSTNFLSSSAFGGLVPLDFWWNFDWRWRPTFLFVLLMWVY